MAHYRCRYNLEVDDKLQLSIMRLSFKDFHNGLRAGKNLRNGYKYPLNLLLPDNYIQLNFVKANFIKTINSVRRSKISVPN